MGSVSAVLALFRVHPSRLAQAPRLRVVSREAGTVRIAVDGLVCGACAARTRAALAGVPGVEAAGVDLDLGAAEVRASRRIDEAELTRALDSVVVARAARRWLARALAWRRRRREGRA